MLFLHPCNLCQNFDKITEYYIEVFDLILAFSLEGTGFSSPFKKTNTIFLTEWKITGIRGGCCCWVYKENIFLIVWVALLKKRVFLYKQSFYVEMNFPLRIFFFFLNSIYVWSGISVALYIYFAISTATLLPCCSHFVCLRGWYSRIYKSETFYIYSSRASKKRVQKTWRRTKRDD